MSDPVRCPVCHWPMVERVEDGCVLGNCSFRPSGAVDTGAIWRAHAAAESRARAIRAVVAAQFTAGFACQVFCDSAREVSGAVEAERVRMDYLTVAAVQSAPVEVVDARAYPRDANGHAIVDGGAP